MKAAQVKKYDKNNIELDIVEVAKPQVEKKEVLVKVSAAVSILLTI